MDAADRRHARALEHSRPNALVSRLWPPLVEVVTSVTLALVDEASRPQEVLDLPGDVFAA